MAAEHRGKFIATKLFEKLEQFARNRGFGFATLATESHLEHPLKPSGYKDTPYGHVLAMRKLI